MSIALLLALLVTPEAPYLPHYLVELEGSTARYADCINLVKKDVEIGRIGAQQWASEGGGAPAQHCLAIADLAAGFPKLAAARLTDLSERKDTGSEKTRALILGEAALAWLQAEKTDEATEAIKSALTIAGDLGELQFVAAKVYAAGEQWQAAADAASAAIHAGVKTPELYVTRAKAYHALGRNDDAAEDVVAALNLDPFYIDALTLRGDLAQLGVNIEAYYDTPSTPNKTSGDKEQ
ncbi:MAG: hypothetical protein R3C60_02060 [Parvularculaceae bacterium]